jgi:hypothetical protein
MLRGMRLYSVIRDSLLKNRPGFEKFEKNHHFLRFFHVKLKKNAHPTALYAAEIFPENVEGDAAIFSNQGQPPQKPLRF